MDLLSTISKPVDRAPMLTIFGDAGMGKTTLAATMPDAVFIRTEDGLQAIPEAERPDAFPIAQDVNTVLEQISALLKSEHQYKTLVIDSITKLDDLVVKHIVESDEKKPKSINQALGGYGAGMMAVAAMHRRIKAGCDLLNREKSMNVVFIGHADMEHIELPDSEPFMRYSMRLSKKSIAPYTDDVDLIGFIKLDMLLKKRDGEKTKAISDGSRVLVCHAAPSNLSKNRYGIESEIPLQKGVNPFSNYIKGINK